MKKHVMILFLTTFPALSAWAEVPDAKSPDGRCMPCIVPRAIVYRTRGVWIGSNGEIYCMRWKSVWMKGGWINRLLSSGKQ